MGDNKPHRNVQNPPILGNRDPLRGTHSVSARDGSSRSASKAESRSLRQTSHLRLVESPSDRSSVRKGPTLRDGLHAQPVLSCMRAYQPQTDRAARAVPVQVQNNKENPIHLWRPTHSFHGRTGSHRLCGSLVHLDVLMLMHGVVNVAARRQNQHRLLRK